MNTDFADSRRLRGRHCLSFLAIQAPKLRVQRRLVGFLNPWKSASSVFIRVLLLQMSEMLRIFQFSIPLASANDCH